MFVVCLIPFLLLGTRVDSHDPNIALKFGYDLTSYIMLDLDMSPLEEEVTVCVGKTGPYWKTKRHLTALQNI